MRGVAGEALEAQRDVVVRCYSARLRCQVASVGRTLADTLRRHAGVVRERERERERGGERERARDVMRERPDAIERERESDEMRERDAVRGSAETTSTASEVSAAIVASLVAADCKGEERLIVKIAHQSSLTYAEAIPMLGEVRAYVSALSPPSPLISSLSRVLYGGAVPVVSTVAGPPQLLLRAQGLASLLFPHGGAVVQPSALQAPSLALLDELQHRLDALGPPLSDELPSRYAARLLSSLGSCVGDDGRVLHTSRVWTAFHCRCVAPPATPALMGQELVCSFCGKRHLIK